MPSAALALQRIKGPLRTIFDSMIYISIMIPGIVIGIATLVALASVFDVLNPIIADVWLGDKAPKLELGMITVIAAHTLFTMSLVIVIVRARIAGMDRALIEADYVLTNRDVGRQADFIERTTGYPEGMDRASLMHAAGVPETAIGDFLDGLEARWGGPLGYLRSIGVSEATMDDVRREFLED